jgi:hypothetical protein
MRYEKHPEVNAKLQNCSYNHTRAPIINTTQATEF